MNLDDLMKLGRPELGELMRRSHPVSHQTVAGNQYLGVALQLPSPMVKLLWLTFRKTFVSHESGVRGWNVRMEQTGVDGPARPLRDRQGRALSFGHYHLRHDPGFALTEGWPARDVLDYGRAGNPWYDPGRLGYCPLVSVGEDGAELLLGWEVFRPLGLTLALPTWYALRRQGPVEEMVPPPGA